MFDAIPMLTVNGKPNNGMIVYQMIRYGKRTDYNPEPFISSTSDVEDAYQEEMKKIKEMIEKHNSEDKEKE